MANELTIGSNARVTLDRLAGFRALSLDDLLIALCSAGKPRLARMGRGWYCAIDMHVAAAGTEFKIQSEFDRLTPIEAARQCAERVVATLKQYAA